MSSRIQQDDVYQLCPQIPKHLLALGKIQYSETLTPNLIHLVKLRVSQINHCAFCQHMHAAEARGDGEQQARLDVLPAWREAGCFSDQEKAALAWAEALTRISDAPVDTSIYQYAADTFNSEEMLALTCVILEINAWNRLSVGFGFVPKID